MSINFLLESAKLLHNKKYATKNLSLIYDFLINFDEKTMNEYSKKSSILSYNNDLDLYVEVVIKMIKIFEDNEEYEKCHILKMKKLESQDIITNPRTKKHEHSKNE